MKRTPLLVAACTAALLFLPVTLRSQSRDQVDRIQDSIQVVRDLTQQPDMRIPQHLLERAEAIVVVPDMIRGGFVVGAKHGKGIVSVRNRPNDRWSPPAFIKMTGGSIGWQIGAQSVDLVLLVMNPNGVRKLLDNRFTLGGDVSATAGPVGRSASAATDVSLESEILAYSRSKGLFAGATFEGVALRADEDANADFYGPELDLRQIVLEPSSRLRIPMSATAWTDAIRELTKSRVFGQDDRYVERSDRGRVDDRFDDRRMPPPPAPSWADGAEPITITLLADRPDRYYGRRVAITAAVEDVYSPTSFALDEDTQYSSGRKVIVINPLPAYRVDDRSRVTVVGTLYKFNKGDIEKRLGGWRWDVPSATVNSFKDHPVLIAESIRMTGRELVGPPPPMAPPAPSYTTPPPGFNGMMLAVSELALRPNSYRNREVMVTASVESVYSRSVFAVDDDRLLTTGRSVLVVAPTAVRPIHSSMDVSVIGKLIRFDKGDIEKFFKGYRLDLRDDLEDLLDDKPVILATSIRTRDGEELVGNRVIR